MGEVVDCLPCRRPNILSRRPGGVKIAGAAKLDARRLACCYMGADDIVNTDAEGANSLVGFAERACSPSVRFPPPRSELRLQIKLAPLLIQDFGECRPDVSERLLDEHGLTSLIKDSPVP